MKSWNATSKRNSQIIVDSIFSRFFSTPTIRCRMFSVRCLIACNSFPKSLSISSATKTTDANCRSTFASVQFAINVKSSVVCCAAGGAAAVIAEFVGSFAKAVVCCVGRDKKTGSIMR